MESRENPIFGRKIFFINPAMMIENYLVEYLRSQEYEVYIIRDYRKAKNLLSAHTDSMCFIDIDADLSYGQWFSYMRSFSFTNALSTIYLGIVTEKAGLEEKDKFLMNIRLPGGFNVITRKPEVLKSFSAILDLNGAKGRRKYIRLDTRGLNDVRGYMTSDNRLFTVDVKDLSSSGFAVTFKAEIASLFQKNTLIRNICISAGRKSMVCSCVVFNTLVNQDGSAMSVLMLTNENPESTRAYIRNFIFEKLDEKMNEVIKNTDNDVDSYSDTDEYDNLNDFEVLNSLDSPDSTQGLDSEDGFQNVDYDMDIL